MKIQKINIESQKELMVNQLGIIGQSALIKNAIEQLIQVAPTDLVVLILGDTGTGKEVFANAIHKLSKRSRYPFLSVNCAAIPETLLESELFGYERGAFTGANERRIGFFESANKGTLFLDEIGEMPLSIQVKLLRILETGEFSRLGSSEIHKVQVRIVAATNRNIENEVYNGNFRSDLFYRLNSFRIYLPSLKERKEDIPLLFDFFAKKTAELNKFTFQGISQEAMNILQKLEWNGNIRELKNFTEKVVTLENGKYLTLPIIQKYLPLGLPVKSVVFNDDENKLIPIKSEDDFKKFETTLFLKALFQLESKIDYLKNQNEKILNDIDTIKQEIYQMPANNYYSVEEENSDNWAESLNSLNLENIEKELIMFSLKKYNGNRKMAAQSLGISLRTFYRKLKYYNLNIEN